MWDQRYAAPGYLFGTDPARFLSEHANHLPQDGRVLCVADGEGRNAVFLAARGLDVTAFDASPVAIGKARKLAEERGVTVHHALADIDGWDWEPGAYDAVVAIFIQFAPPSMRKRIFEGMKRTLRPGGVLMLHGYRPEQIAHGTGGPPDAENLYTEDLLEKAFGDFEILRLSSYESEIEEGKGHVGMSALIDLIAIKP